MELGYTPVGSNGLLTMLTIIGQGLVGTLAGLKAERGGQSFRIIDEGSGFTASRAAAGLYNPLTGPRFTPAAVGWEQMVHYYEDIEQYLGVSLVHPLILQRPLHGSKVREEAFPISAPGWSAQLCPHSQSTEPRRVTIEGGGWVDISILLDVTRARWLRSGVLEERRFSPGEGQSRTVLWCCGPQGYLDPRWSTVPGVMGVWQGVRGDVLTVRIPHLSLEQAEIGKRFLLPLGGEQFRWGATHEIDVMDFEYRDSARRNLESDLRERIGPLHFEVIDHRWGVRPASRTGIPMMVRHPDEPDWTFLNGFGGRGISQLPSILERLEL